MREFKNIYDPRIIKKEILSVKAKESPEFSKFLPPEEIVTVCNCIIKTIQHSNILITGVRYKSLGWEHVLVRAEGRYPTYREMVMAKKLFWENNEVAFQIYPPDSENVNNEIYTLHIWRKFPIKKTDEYYLKKGICECYEKARDAFDGNRKSFEIKDNFGSRILIYGPMCWQGWEDFAKIKRDIWGPETAGVQFHVSSIIDDNPEYITIIWDAKELKLSLPNVELV